MNENENLNVEQEKTFDEILENKSYQSEFDKRLSKAIATAKSNWENEAKKSQTEAEKLARMDAEQKANYELDLKTKENEDLKRQLNSLTLSQQANSYASEKGLPIGYLEMIDYSRETAESVKEKIDKLIKLRGSDLDTYLKDKLKQSPPKAVETTKKQEEDLYIKGFKNYKKK